MSNFFIQAETFAGALDAQLSDFEFPDDFVLDVRWLNLSIEVEALLVIVSLLLTSLPP